MTSHTRCISGINFSHRNVVEFRRNLNTAFPPMLPVFHCIEQFRYVREVFQITRRILKLRWEFWFSSSKRYYFGTKKEISSHKSRKINRMWSISFIISRVNRMFSKIRRNSHALLLAQNCVEELAGDIGFGGHVLMQLLIFFITFKGNKMCYMHYT